MEIIAILISGHLRNLNEIITIANRVGGPPTGC